MKKMHSFFSRPATRLSCAGLCAFFGLYLTFPTQGIFATLGLSLFLGMLCAQIYPRFPVLIPIATLTAFLLSLALCEGVASRVFFTLVPSAFLAAGGGVVLLFRHARKKRSPRLLATALLLLTVLIVAHLLVFGTPVGILQSEQTASETYEARYANEDFTALGTYYDPLRAEYVSEFQVKTERAHFSAPLSEDGYLALMQTRAAALQKSDLLALLHEHFSDGEYHVKVSLTELSPVPCDYVLGAQPREWLIKNDIVLEFDRSFPLYTPAAKANFASTVREYVRLLQEEDFPFSSITIRAGEQGEMVYELAATPDTDVQELVAPTVKELKKLD